MSDHAPRTIQRHCDVAVVGGSAAGLAAALQLGRQRRSVIVLDAGAPRNAPAAHLHSYLGADGHLLPVDLDRLLSLGDPGASGPCRLIADEEDRVLGIRGEGLEVVHYAATGRHPAPCDEDHGACLCVELL